MANAERPKLICVEDDPTVLASVVRLLEKDFQVLTARTADEALSTLEANPDVAIVLADHRLPGPTGLSLLTLVRERSPDTVRALFSGKIVLQEVVDAINSSLLHRFILKPWDNDYFRLQMLEALAVHSTLKEKRTLEELSVTDPITGLKNHRYFQARLKIEVERADRHKRPLTLAMIDIDHFKKVNDRYGHPIGDEVLKAVAQRLNEKVRSLDTVARYGGEEFAIIMPDTPIDAGYLVAERIRRACEETPVECASRKSIAITFSIGVAAFGARTSTADELIRIADQALYQAKSQGRNQTVGAADRT